MQLFLIIINETDIKESGVDGALFYNLNYYFYFVIVVSILSYHQSTLPKSGIFIDK